MRKHYPLNAAGVEDAGLLPWTDGVPATGVEGSYPGQALVTDTEAEALNAIAAAGLPFSGADLTQLAQAISRGIYVGGFTGSANALAASLPNNIAFPSLLPGMRFQGVALTSNTGAVTLTLTGFGAPPGTLNLLRRDGNTLKPGDIQVGAPFAFGYDGSAYRMAVPVVSEIKDTASPASTALWHSGVAGGSTGSVTASVSPAITSYEDRTPILLTFPNGIASGATGALNDLDAIPFQRNDGSPIQAADVPPGAQAAFTIVGTGALRLIGLGRGEVQRVVASPIVYVRPDGNDANDGSGNDAARAKRTILSACRTALERFTSTSQVLIQLGASGTYESPPVQVLLAGRFTIQGTPGNQNDCIVQGDGTANSGVGVFNFGSGSTSLLNLTLDNTGTTNPTLSTNFGASAYCENVTFRFRQASVLATHLLAGPVSNIAIGPGCFFQAGTASSCWSAFGGTIQLNLNSTTVVGSPTFTTAFAYATAAGQIQVVSGGSVSGAATGPRYFSEQNSLINTRGGGANFFPGSTPGSTATQGLYV